VILVDDGSTDTTLQTARQLGLEVCVHDRNYGDGVDQKTCYTEAIRAGADPTLVPEIIAQAVAAGFRIDEIAVPTRYFKEASQASFLASMVYGMKILAVCFWYLLHAKGIRRSRRFSSLRARYDPFA
jgi:glycosyltransferase involved in cell wall biosynthesis